MGYKLTNLHSSFRVVSTPFPDLVENCFVETQSYRQTKHLVCGGVEYI